MRVVIEVNADGSFDVLVEGGLSPRVLAALPANIRASAERLETVGHCENHSALVRAIMDMPHDSLLWLKRFHDDIETAVAGVGTVLGNMEGEREP